MLGVALGLGSALFNASENAVINHVKVRPFTVTLMKFGLGSILITPLLLINGITITNNYFWLVMFISSLIFVFGSYFYIKAIQLSGIAHTIPFYSFTPIFSMLVGMVMLGEQPGPYALFGVICIVIGAYLINIQRYKEGIFEPFLFIFKEKGSMIMFILAVVFGLASNLYKLGIQMSSPLTMLGLEYYTALTLIVLFILFTRKKIEKKLRAKHIFLPLSAMVFFALGGDIMMGFAMRELFVAYAISLKRLTIIFSIIFGYVFFKEKIRDPLLGGSVMLAGVVLITMFG